MRVEDNKHHLGPTERRLNGVRLSLRPVLASTNYFDRGGVPRDSGFYNQTTLRGTATGKAEKEMMMAQIPPPTVKAYTRPSHPGPSTSPQMNIARTTLTPSVMPIRLKAVATGVAMATPTATSAHLLVRVEQINQHQLPLSSPLQDLADRWARELDIARERRKELKRQFRRDFGIVYGGYS